MAQILINISDEEYEDFKKLKECGFGAMFNGLVERIANGVVLYGDLIDRKRLLSQFGRRYAETRYIVKNSLAEGFIQCEELVKEQKPVIEADKEEYESD